MSLNSGSMIYLDVPSVALGNGSDRLTLAGADGLDASRPLQPPCGPAAQHGVGQRNERMRERAWQETASSH